MLGGTGTDNCGKVISELDVMTPAVPFVVASPTIKGVLVLPAWRIEIAPPLVPLALEILTSTPLLSAKVPLTVRRLPALRSILPPADWRVPVTAMLLAAFRAILPLKVAIASTTISPADSNITGPPAVEIDPTVMLFPNAVPREPKKVSPVVKVGGTFGVFARFEIPERKIKAGLLDSKTPSGSVTFDKVVSGPVILISPP